MQTVLKTALDPNLSQTNTAHILKSLHYKIHFSLKGFSRIIVCAFYIAHIPAT